MPNIYYIPGKGYGKFDDNVTLEEAYKRYGVASPQPKPAPKDSSAVARGFGGAVSGIGSTLRDVGFEDTGTSLQEWGQDVVKRNPAEYNSISDIKSAGDVAGFAWEKFKESAPQLGLGLAAGLAGGPVTAGAVLGGTSLAQGYGETREAQRAQGIDDRGRALMTALPAAALDVGLGGEGALLRAFGKGVAEETGKSFLKSTGRAALEEAATEPTQQALQRYGSYKDLTSPEAMEEYATSALAGGLVGGVVGGGLYPFTPTKRPPAPQMEGETASNLDEAGKDLLRLPPPTAYVNSEGETRMGSDSLTEAERQASAGARYEASERQRANQSMPFGRDIFMDSPVGAQGNLLKVSPDLAPKVEGEAPSRTEAQDQEVADGQADLFADVPTAEVKSMVGIRQGEIMGVLRGVGTDTPLKASAGLTKLSAKLSEAAATEDFDTIADLLATSKLSTKAIERGIKWASDYRDLTQAAREQEAGSPPIQQRLQEEARLKQEQAMLQQDEQRQGEQQAEYQARLAEGRQRMAAYQQEQALNNRNDYFTALLASRDPSAAFKEFHAWLGKNPSYGQQALLPHEREAYNAAMERLAKRQDVRAAMPEVRAPEPQSVAPPVEGQVTAPPPRQERFSGSRVTPQGAGPATEPAAPPSLEAPTPQPGLANVPTILQSGQSTTEPVAKAAPLPPRKRKEKVSAPKTRKKPEGSVSERVRAGKERQASEAGGGNRLEQIKAIAEKRKREAAAVPAKRKEVDAKLAAKRLADAKLKEAAAKEAQEARLAKSKAKDEAVEVPNLEGDELYSYQNVSGQIDTALETGEITPMQSRTLKSLIALRVEPAAIQQAVKDAAAQNKSRPKASITRGGNRKASSRAERNMLADALQRELKRLGLNKVGLGVVADLIETAQGKAEGTYQAGNVAEARSGFRALINVVFNDKAKALETLHHEAIHYMRDANLITEAEWTTLTDIVKADKNLMSYIRNNWKGLSEESQIEEAVAEKFREWMRTQKAIAPGIRGVFQRMRNFFNTIRLGFNKPAFAEAKAIFESINAGERNDKNVTSLRSNALKSGALKLSPSKGGGKPASGALKPDTDFHSKIDYYDGGLRTANLGGNPQWAANESHYVAEPGFPANKELPNQVVEVQRFRKNGQNITRISVSRKSTDARLGDRGNHFAVSAYIRDGVITDADGLISMLNQVAEQLASQPQRASEAGIQQQAKDFIDSQLPKYAAPATEQAPPAGSGAYSSPQTFSMADNPTTRSKVADAIAKVSEGNGPDHIQIDLNQGTSILSGGELPAKLEAPARPAPQVAGGPTPQPASTPAPAPKAASTSTPFPKAAPAPAPKPTPTASEAKVTAKVEKVNQKIETRLEKKNIPPQLGNQTSLVAEVFNKYFNKFARKAMTHTLIESAVKAGLTKAGVYQSIELDKARVRYNIEQRISKVLEGFDSLPNKLREVGGEVNSLLQDSTMAGKWAFEPSWLKEGSYEVDPELQKRFEALPAEGQKFVREVFEANNDLRQQLMDTVDAAIDEPYDRLIAEATAAGNGEQVRELKREREGLRAQKTLMFRVDPTKPYASLRRQGKFAVSAKSEEFVAAQESGDNKLIQELQSAPEHNFFNKYETEAEAKAEVKRLQGLGLYSDVIATTDDSVVNEISGGRETFQAFQRIFKALEDRDGLSEQAKRTLQSVITDLHVMSMTNSSARKSEIKRKNVYGGDLDMVRNFATQSRAMAYHIASLKNNDMLMEAINGMNKEVRSAPDTMEASKFRDEILLRHVAGLRVTPNNFVETMKRLTAVYKIAFSPSFYIQNFTQVPMVVGPELAARVGAAKSAKYLNGAMEEVAKAWKGTKWTESLNIDALPKDVRGIVQQLADISLIDVGLDADLGNMQSTRGRAGEKWGQTGEALDKASQAFVSATNIAQDLTRKQESINRVATAIAGYRLELERTGDRQKAVDYATDLVRNTMGTYDGFNAPRYMQGVGGIPLQFRKFQLMQVTLLMRHIQNGYADPNVSPEERAIARQALKYQIGTAALMGGMRALPGATALIWLYNTFFGGDDEPADAEAEIRAAIGDNDAADFLIYGPPSVADINLSGMLGFGNTFSILPYTKLEATKEGVAKAAFDLAGAGPATFRDIGLAAKDTYDGLQEGSEDYYRGLEKMLPKGFANAVTAYREATGGIKNYQDDQLVSADEVDFFDTAKTLLGVQSVTNSERFRKQDAEKVLDRFFKDKSTLLKKQYVNAVKAGDQNAREEAVSNWKDMQDAREEAGKKRQPLSALMKASSEQEQQEEMTVGGVQYRAKDERYRQALLDEAEED
jgi:hypothetical protein